MSNGVMNKVSFKRESAWGTAVVPDKSLPINFTGGIKTSNETKFINAAKGVLAKNLGSTIGNRKHEGEYETDLFPDYPSYLFLSALGAVSSALVGGETIVYIHTITESETKPSLTIEQALGEDVRRFAGAIATGFKLTAKTGDFVKVSFPIVAKTAAVATAITPAYLNNAAFAFHQVSVKIGGSAIFEVASLELEYNNNAELKHALAGTNDPSFMAIKPSEVKGKIELYLDSTSLAQLTAYLANTEQSLQVLVTGGAIGSASNNKFDLSIPRAVITSAETKISDDYNLVTIEFNGLYDTATTKLLDLKITNLLANLT
jgi:Phage tail tube protein